MTPKIARFLREQAPPTPFLVVDLERVAASYLALAQAMPHARIYYAVKANPAEPVLRALVGLGSCFDAASEEEVRACIAVGADPARISYGNTIKKESAIARSFAAGVRLYAFDSEEELEKLARAAPGAQVYCRILVENEGADWPLSRKFGCSVEMARELMLKAGEMGLDPMGLSFHVGSQQTDAVAYEAAIAKVAMLFTDLAERGVNLRMLNLGGGFPVRYRAPVPGIDHFAEAISRALVKAFGNAIPEIVVEPGRFIVAEAGVLASEVVLVSRKAKDDPVRWVYLDVGRFSGLAETEGEAIKYRISTPHDGTVEGPVAVAGPTCDSVDTLYEKAGYTLPLALKAGDQVTLHATGAYTTMYSSVGFNGFAPLQDYYV